MAITKDRGSAPGRERYYYDFKACTADKGWAQLDTEQDAPYYGAWVNPFSLELMSYTEGDTCHTTCETVEEFKKEVIGVLEWNRKMGYWSHVDTMCRPEIVKAFQDMGFRLNKYDCVKLDPEGTIVETFDAGARALQHS